MEIEEISKAVSRGDKRRVYLEDHHPFPYKSMGSGMLTYMKTIEHQQKSGEIYNRPMDPSWDLVSG